MILPPDLSWPCGLIGVGQGPVLNPEREARFPRKPAELGGLESDVEGIREGGGKAP